MSMLPSAQAGTHRNSFVQAEFVNTIVGWIGTDLVLSEDYPTTGTPTR